MTTQQPGFSMSQYASSKDLFAAMIARITELESQLAQRFDAADMATAAAQGFRDGATATAQPEPTPDELRAIARQARNSSGSASDDCGPSAYVLHGWRAALASHGQAPAGESDGFMEAVNELDALHEVQPAPATQQAGVALSDDLRDRLVAISEAIADQDDRAAQAMLREILKAPPADSVLYDPRAVLDVFHSARAGSEKPVGYLRGIRAVIAHWESRPEPHRWLVPARADSVQEDAALWHWLAEYLVGTRTDLDDEIVASETVNDLRKLVEAARKQGASHD